jgi:uncharacterized protein YbjT (DUF2867 family)
MLRVLVAGATGLVGREVVARLRADPRVVEVLALQRRAGPDAPKLRVLAVDFERLDRLDPKALAADAAVCALGTTIRVAGSRAAFRRVDHDYVVAFAQCARASGATRFGLVSALGADPQSRVFYNRVKGETEAAVEAMDFASLSIVQPSLLLGARDEVRLGERLAAPFARCLPRRWRAVPGGAVAQALVDAVLIGASGTRRINNAELSNAELI